VKSLFSCLVVLLALQAPAFADPAGRARLREVLAEHGSSEPLVVLSHLARGGSFSIDEADVVAAATSGEISPALRTLLSNTRTIGVADGRLVLSANRAFEVPTQNGGALRFDKRFGIAPGDAGRAEVRGLQVGPQRYPDNRNRVRTVLLDRDGIYGFDVGTGPEPREVWLRPRVEPEPEPEQPRAEAPVEQPPVEQPPVEQPPVEQPRVEQPPVEQPRAEQPAQPRPAQVEELSPTQRYQAGLHVLALEKALARLGYEIQPDRFFDFKTQEALRDFQLERDLPASGDLDEATITALRLALRAADRAETPAEPAPAPAEPAPAEPAPAAAEPAPAPAEPAPAEQGQRGAEDALRDLFNLSPSSSGAAFRPLAPGARGDRVSALQRDLNRAGASIAVDGQFGPGTESALRAFQEAKGLPVTGSLDAATERALQRAARRPALEQGDRGADVTRLQQALRNRGQSLRADGQFGPATKGAVEDFQRAEGLPATGVVDADTWARLEELRRGDSGERVRQLQEDLNRVRRAQGLAPIEVDGKFGPGTEEALKALQQTAGLEASGRASPELLEVLRRQRRNLGETPLLQPGDRSPAVERLQDRLNAHRAAAGLPQLVDDGIFGPSTETALETFQRGAGLPETGVADPATWAKLNAEPEGNVQARALRRGDEHPEVGLLQNKLNRHRAAAGESPLAVDNNFGPATESAVRSFQGNQGLPQTGRADPATVAALDQEPDMGPPAAEPTDPGPAPTGDLRGVRIALDVGHGHTHRSAFDPGAVNSTTGLTEFEVNYQVGQALAQHLRSMSANVSLFAYPRGSSQRLTLFRKGARAAGHHIFISLHHNAANRSAQGSLTLVHTSRTNSGSRALANAIQSAMVRDIWGGASNRNLGVRGQRLGVLSGAHSQISTAVLVEGFFVDPPSVTRAVASGWAVREARAIASGVAAYWASRR